VQGPRRTTTAGAVAGVLAGLAFLAPASGVADSLTVEASSFQASASGCAGTLLANQQRACDGPVLPTTQGSSAAEQSADAAGNFFVRDTAEGGDLVESRRAESDVDITAAYVLAEPAVTVRVTVRYRLDATSHAAEGGAAWSVGGSAFTYRYTDPAPTPVDSLLNGSSVCDDGSQLLVQDAGPTSSSFRYDTPPGVYAFSVTYYCTSPGGTGKIVPGTGFAASLSVGGLAWTNNSAKRAEVSASGALEHVSWTMTQ